MANRRTSRSGICGRYTLVLFYLISMTMANIKQEWRSKTLEPTKHNLTKQGSIDHKCILTPPYHYYMSASDYISASLEE